MSVRLTDLPIGMDLIGDTHLYVHTKSALQIWATNQFNVNFTTLSSEVSHLIYIPQVNKPSRIIARTSDGINRIISPINGRTITANLPLLETDTVLDVAYFTTSGKSILIRPTFCFVANR